MFTTFGAPGTTHHPGPVLSFVIFIVCHSDAERRRNLCSHHGRSDPFRWESAR